MCLAKAYLRPPPDPDIALTEGGTGVNGSLLVMENVTQVDVDGNQIRLKSLFGDTETLQGRVLSIDFAEARLVLQSAT